MLYLDHSYVLNLISTEHSALPTVQSVMSLIADQGVVGLIRVRFLTFMETDHEIFSMIILLLSLIQEGLVSVASKSM